MVDGAAGLLWLLLAGLQIQSGTLVGWLLALNSTLVAGMLLMRNRAKQRGSAAEHGIAYLSALLPLAVHPGGDGIVLVVFGTLFGLWALLSLGRSFGIAPADRGIVESGPYRLVRHPLYLAALISTLGAVWGRWTGWNLGVLALLSCSLGYRIRAEERILGPAYRAYRARVRWRLLPLVWGSLLLLAIPVPARAETAHCGPVWNGSAWSFDGVVTDLVDYDQRWVILHLAWVQCTDDAGIWVVRSAEILAGEHRGIWQIGDAVSPGDRVHVETPGLGEHTGPQSGVDWATCSLPWCTLAAEADAQNAWTDRAFICSGYGPAWYPWGFLFWRLRIMTDNGHQYHPQNRAALGILPGSEARRFVLYRERDVSGVSGTGVVAEGVRFSDGRVALVWLRAPGALSVFAGIGDLMQVHGHEGLSSIVWLDE